MSPERRAPRTTVVTRVAVAVAALALAALLAWAVIARVGASGAQPGVAASPSATGTTAPATPASPPVVDADCTAELTVTGEWPGGFGAELVVTSRAGTAGTAGTADRWQLSWTFPADAHVTELWDATLLHDGADGQPVRVTAPDWDLDLGPGESVTVGFNGVRGATTPRPADVTLDGAACVEPGADAPAPSVAHEAPADGAFYVDPDTQAAAAALTATGADRDAALRIAGTPQAMWLVDGGDAAAARAQVADYTARAQAAGQIGVVVVYAIPGRDCGSHSAGGADEQGYRDWVAQVAAGLVGEPWVVLEPDALAQLGDCDGQGDRAGMLRDAARLLDDAGARVYLDVGHPAWLSAQVAADRLRQVGLDHLAGFALNVSNYRTTAESREYGEQVSALAGGARYVVDTSRNGNGPGDDWCNPPGRALGDAPRTVDDGTALDALLWVKSPGESDGTCRGGPAAGVWWPQMARELAGG